MTNLIRLLDDDPDDFERALLVSADADSGSESARARALAVFGGASVSLATTSAAAAPTAGSLSPVSVSKATLGLFIKWLGVGVVVGGVSASGVHGLTTAGSSEPVRSTPAVPAVATEARAAVVPAPEQPLPSAQPEVSSVVRSKHFGIVPAPPVTDAPVTATSNGAFPVASADSHLREELALLEQAREALHGGNVTLSQRALAEYTKRFPRGALSREAEVLVVEARLAAGDVAGARATAARALATEPDSLHARRMRALLTSRRNP